jgi:hypothetical protein
MHRKKRLSPRQWLIMLFRTEHYCVCDCCTECGCGIWEAHHSSLKYITPAFVRPFDGLRHHTQSLWCLVSAKGSRLAQEFWAA